MDDSHQVSLVAQNLTQAILQGTIACIALWYTFKQLRRILKERRKKSSKDVLPHRSLMGGNLVWRLVGFEISCRSAAAGIT